MKVSFPKLLLGGIAFAAGAWCCRKISDKFTGTMMKVATNREQPETVRKLMEFIPQDEYTVYASDITKQSREELLQMDLETAETVSFDGVRLIGHYYACPGARRTLIAVHGWRSQWFLDFSGIYPFFLEEKCNLLFVEQRGQGKSEGDYMTFGLLERYDVKAWTEWLDRTHPSELPIYLVGVSMGATTVLMASALDLPDRVRGVIADCGFTSPKAIWTEVSEQILHIPYPLLDKTVDDFCRKELHLPGYEYSTVDALKVTRLPVLFIHGSDDHFVPTYMTYENYRACRSEKKLLIVPGAGHGMSYLVEKNKYESTVRDFFREFDAPET